jgi:cytochrome c553
MRVNLQCAVSIAVLAGLAGGAALRATRNYAADNSGANEVWSTKKIMVKLYVGKPSLMSAVYEDVHEAEPDWKSDEKSLAEIIRLMSLLTKQRPLRGSQEAWDKLVQNYVEKAKAARQNVKERKLQAARDSLEQVLSTCDDCHDNHGIK